MDELICEVCDSPLTGRQKKFCSSGCRTKDRYKRANSIYLESKPCASCREHKDIELFSISNRSRDGRSHICKDCDNARGRIRGKSDGHLATYKRHLRVTYGLTYEEYEDMLFAQGGACSFCGQPQMKRRLSVDHDHETGAVRSLACLRCNKFIISNHNLETAKKLVDYFSHPPADQVFGVTRYVPKGMETGKRKKKRQPRKRKRSK